jgi:hypothetical protein
MEGDGEKHREVPGKARQQAGATREERLAMQLRENLKKRKALARAKQQQAGDSDA